MAKDEKYSQERLDIALDRIAAERAARTGSLDLGNLGLTSLPSSLWELDWLEELRLGGVIQKGGITYRCNNESTQKTDEEYLPNRLDDILPSLTRLPHLSRLDCMASDLRELEPLAKLTALRSFNCSRTQVADITPLAGLCNLHTLKCSVTQVTDLTPLAGLSALEFLNCSGSQVADLSPLVALSNLQNLNCGGTRVVDLIPVAKLSALQTLNCSGTQVADISYVSGLGNLQNLRFGSTRVLNLSPLAGLRNLQTLDFSHSRIADLAPLSKLTGLHTLRCGRTQVANLAPVATLIALRSLDCSWTPATDLAPLAGLTVLESLDCSATRVVDLAPLAKLPALRYLNCSVTQITDLTPVASLNALQVLYCMNSNIADLTPLAGLTALQTIDCSRTQVVDLTPLAGFYTLQNLRCTMTRVVDLTPLAGLSALQNLDFSMTQVADLAPLIGLSNLRSLFCSETRISDLTPLAKLPTLQSLGCSFTHVADLAPLTELTTLQSLVCGQTQINDLAPLSGLVNLQHLGCWANPIADLSPLAGLSYLQDIDFRDTLVADLTPLAGLTALRSLKCGRRQAAGSTSLLDLNPLAGLDRLQMLYLWEAAVDGLPEAIIRLHGLRSLIINSQPNLQEIPAEVLSQDGNDNCLPRLRAHLADLGTDAKPLRDVKVIVLGNGRVGKTQLCRRLRGEAFEPNADSTHGIHVTSFELGLPEETTTAVLNLWDFGGQDIYHGTHSLFMRTRAIFLLVWTPEREQGEHQHGGMVFRDQPLPYWLEYIRHLGAAKSPVILVQTRCDGGLGECPNLPVEECFLDPLLADSRLFTRVAYSAKDDIGRASVMDALQRAVVQLRKVQGCPLIGRGRLAVWDQLRAWRDADAAEADPGTRFRRLLAYRDFEDLCARHGVTSSETFVEVLHHAGMVFYRPHLFEDQLILDQSWALDAVYAVFTREGAVYETLRSLGGRFNRPLLDALLWRARGLSAADQRSLIDMMQASGICFEHRRGDDPDLTEYVAPDLLPEGRTGPPSALAGELAARWDPIQGEPLTASFRYPFISPSIGRMVLSELGQLGRDAAVYWRYGLCFYDAKSRASAILETVADTDAATAPSSTPGYGGRLQLRIKGDGAEQLLVSLVDRLDKLNQTHGWASELEDSGSRLTRSHARTGEEKVGEDPGVTGPTLADPPAESPATPEVYVSYAWKQDRAEPLVDDLIEVLRNHGIQVQRDSDQLQPGDSISGFMKRLTAGRCVLLVISEAYLRSLSCMTELRGIWVNACQRGDLFRKRIVPLVQADAAISTPARRIEHAIHWKQQHEKVDELIRQHGADVVGTEDFRRFKLIGDFYRDVGDMLSFADDVLVPRDRPTLSSENFAVVRDLIERALEQSETVVPPQ